MIIWGSGDRGVFATLFLYEIKRLLRYRRVILIAVVAPLLLYPVMIFILRRVDQSEARRLDEAIYEYALTGDEAGWGRAVLAKALALELDQPGEDHVHVHFEDRSGLDAEAMLQEGQIHVLVEALSSEEYERIRAEEDVDSADSQGGGSSDAGGTQVVDVDLPLRIIRLKYRAQSDFSRTAADRLRERLVEVRGLMRDSVYRAGGFPVEPAQVGTVVTENLASPEKEGGAVLGLALTPFLLLLMLTGGSIMAVDAISGEKERGTLETLLATGASRTEIVSAKQLAIIVVGVAVAVINILNLLLYLVLGLFQLPENFAVSLSLLDLVLLLVLFLPLTVLISNALLLLSGYAKSYKEYQIYFFPLLLAFLAPSVAGVLPGMDLHSAVALVPVAGISVAVREIMLGEYDWIFLVLAQISTSLAALWAARLTERTLSTERLISHADLDEADLLGGPALFPRHVLRWFGVMWVVFLLISLWFGQELGLRGQVAVNLVGIFLGGSILMIRHYRLDVREAFALRRVHPAVWLAVVIGAPAGYVLGIGLAGLVNTYLFPVPQNVLEAFGDVMLGNDIPLWQLILFLSIMPGVLEELAFRGVLLHGLRKIVGPVGICLVVGAIFGIFHVSLFRLIPTAYLGALLAAVVLLTGSIFPVMVWHAASNAIALVPAYLGWVSEDPALPGWIYGAAVLALAVTFWILWLVRRPYPGLRKTPPPGLES
ncbi:MAG: ABC transporter permease subunit [Gemmatimonadota bacterium]